MTIAPALDAQSSRDSAGVLIVENARPAWSASERLSLAAKPRLMIGNSADSAYRFRQVRGVMLLSDGRMAVADGGSLELRLFSARGQFLSKSGGRGNAPGQMLSMNVVRRLRGDTIAIGAGRTSVGLYANAQRFVRTADFGASGTGPAPASLLVALVNSGVAVLSPVPRVAPHAVGSRWTESLPLKLATASSGSPRDLDTLPYIVMEQTSAGPTPVWLSSVGVVAATDDHFYAGFGNRYEIRVYGADGKLQSKIRRAWTPTPITDEDWERWVVEWSQLWVRSTGAEREREVQKVRESPWAEQNPAFSQFIVDRGGRLWVRDAHWQDAIAAGALDDIPAVPSSWSVFDGRGRWLGDVSMPAGFKPFEIGTDYVAGVLRADGVNYVAVYDLGRRR